MIVGVAVRLHGLLFALPRPARHPNLAAAYNREARRLGYPCPWVGYEVDRLLDGEQGFVNQKGEFLTRADAAVDAIHCGQVPPEFVPRADELFSEDVW